MRVQLPDEIPDSRPKITHISVPCTESQKQRYETLKSKLKAAKKENILPAWSRNAIDQAMDHVESLLGA